MTYTLNDPEAVGAGVTTTGTVAAGPVTSAVSWPAIIAGGVVASAASLILLALGAGLGLASLSPWASHGPSPVAFTTMAAIWLIVVQWAASGVGGYLTGRLRTRWTGLHTHEVFFRDTAHGFLAWALSTLVVAALFGSAAIGVARGAANAVQPATAPTAAATDAALPVAPSPLVVNDVDYLFRSTHPDVSPSSLEARAEAGRILSNSLVQGTIGSEDAAYLYTLIVEQTGATPDEARRRLGTVSEHEQQVATATKQAADSARKTAATVSLITSLSLLIGALIACVAAALGGLQRDEHP